MATINALYNTNQTHAPNAIRCVLLRVAICEVADCSFDDKQYVASSFKDFNT